jgi:hypothetical protein
LLGCRTIRDNGKLLDGPILIVSHGYVGSGEPSYIRAPRIHDLDIDVDAWTGAFGG